MDTLQQIDTEELTKLIVKTIPLIDNNSQREGLRETPKRYAKFFKEFLDKKPFNVTTFDSEGYDEMIVQTGVPFYSMCEHHMVPADTVNKLNEMV